MSSRHSKHEDERIATMKASPAVQDALVTLVKHQLAANDEFETKQQEDAGIATMQASPAVQYALATLVKKQPTAKREFEKNQK